MTEAKKQLVYGILSSEQYLKIINAHDKYAWTALIHAVYSDKIECMCIILDAVNEASYIPKKGAAFRDDGGANKIEVF